MNAYRAAGLLVLPIACAGLFCAPRTARAQEQAPAQADASAPLAPRSLYNISPDGVLVAWVEFVEGVDIVVARGRAQPQALALHYEAPGRVADIRFSADGRRMLIELEDDAGVLSAPVDNTSPVPAPGAVTRIGDSGESIGRLSYARPRRVLLLRREASGQVVSAARVDIETGEREEAAELGARVDALYTPFDALADSTLTIRLIMERGPGGVVRARRSGGASGTLLESRTGGVFRALGLSDDGRLLYAIDGRDRPHSALTVTNIETGQASVLVDDPAADVDGALLHPVEGYAQGARFATDPAQWLALQRSIASDLRGLRDDALGAYSVVGRSSDDLFWIVRYDQIDGRPEWRLHDCVRHETSVLPDEAPITSPS